MGYYINQTSDGTQLEPLGKAAALVADGATYTTSSEGFQDNLVCVVNNGPFEAAVYVFSEREFMDFNLPGDRRTKQWLIYEYAPILSGYKKIEQENDETDGS